MNKLTSFIERASYEVFLITLDTLKVLINWAYIGTAIGLIGSTAFYVFVSFYGLTK